MANKISSAPAAFKSPVWQHFGFPTETIDGKEVTNKQLAACKLCDYKTKYTGATTNLSTHLKRHHPEVDIESRTHKYAESKRKSTSESATHNPKQSKLSEVFSRPLRFNCDRATAISRSIAKFIAIDLRPYSIVENAGFKAMIKTLEPKYNIPSRPYFSKTLIPQLYEETKSSVLDELKTASHVAITTDGWTSRAVDSYITITAHYLCEHFENWELCNRVLQTRVIHESHTAVNVGAVLSSAITEWGLARLNGQVPVVTDNASNMDGAVRAVGLLDWGRILSALHTLLT
ncbi:E3 SUMO-protein ligase ZBED1-like [Ylistrum balloti]|uniref:E3 SUMO-protein ligase ZBED1-like n=1 Tax=Ylistrum balloti TaxID=509963 RepID=UPI002905C72F|nr:E3 SUMO-protein ligase ZBED1-like [Ylistrum balloti]